MLYIAKTSQIMHMSPHVNYFLLEKLLREVLFHGFLCYSQLTGIRYVTFMSSLIASQIILNSFSRDNGGTSQIIFNFRALSSTKRFDTKSIIECFWLHSHNRRKGISDYLKEEKN